MFTACLHLLCKVDPAVPVDKNGKLKSDKPWNTAQNLMANPKSFLEGLQGYGDQIAADTVPAGNFKAIRPLLEDPEFTPEKAKGASKAAEGVCSWIINITKYYDVVT